MHINNIYMILDTRRMGPLSVFTSLRICSYSYECQQHPRGTVTVKSKCTNMGGTRGDGLYYM